MNSTSKTVGCRVNIIDYFKLALELTEAGPNIEEALLSTIRDRHMIRQPEKSIWINSDADKEYFWASLLNAAADAGLKPLWIYLKFFTAVGPFALGANKHRSFIDVDFPGHIRIPKLALDETSLREWPLPERGDAPTEANFRNQAAAFDAYMHGLTDVEANYCRSCRFEMDRPCKTLADWVASWYYSGTAVFHAAGQLTCYGFPALATEEGILWLKENYKPAT